MTDLATDISMWLFDLEDRPFEKRHIE